MINNTINKKFSNIAIIIDKVDDCYTCQSNGVIREAKLASSCLAVPGIGDKVSVVFDNQEIYIVHILESNSPLTLKTEELNVNINKLNLNITYIDSKIDSVKSFIKNINIFSDFFNITSNSIKTIAKKKHDIVKDRVNEYDTLNNKINMLEKKNSNITREDINIEHKNVNSSFTKATQQIKFDAKNINLG